MRKELVLAGIALALCLSACAKEQSTDVEIPYHSFPQVDTASGYSGSQADADDGWEKIGQSQITVYDEDGNSQVYDVIMESRDGGDSPPIEGYTRMSRIVEKGDTSELEEEDREVNIALWKVSQLILGITTRDVEMLADVGVENYSTESMESMFKNLETMCTQPIDTVFLKGDQISSTTIAVSAIIPDYSTTFIVEKDEQGEWKIPYVGGMLQSEKPEDLEESENAESDESLDSTEVDQEQK